MSGEKRFSPTARKLRKSRLEGDVAKSRDLTGAIQLATGFLVLFNLFLYIKQLVVFSRKIFLVSTDFRAENVIRFAHDAASVAFCIVASILAAVFLVVLVSEGFQVGVHFTLKPLAPRFSRLNIFQGLKRIFGLESRENPSGLPTRLVFEIGKMALYILLLGVWCGVILVTVFSQVLCGDFLRIGELLLMIHHAGWQLVAGMLVVLVVMGVVDLIIQRHRRIKRLRMDLEEFRRETRESEGDPEIRGMRKQLHREVLLHGLIQGVRKAKVVVVNKKGSSTGGYSGSC